ncbi:hypothetical protein BKH46_08895 [Helicobacter sp. 12S02634-8]|nr:hypothetical protein BKH46_08895 [Helicobacter sp. 12S02634-8]
MRSPQFGWEGQNSPSNSPLPLPRLNAEIQNAKAKRQIQKGKDRKFRIAACSLALSRCKKTEKRLQKCKTTETELMRSEAYHNSSFRNERGLSSLKWSLGFVKILVKTDRGRLRASPPSFDDGLPKKRVFSGLRF